MNRVRNFYILTHCDCNMVCYVFPLECRSKCRFCIWHLCTVPGSIYVVMFLRLKRCSININKSIAETGIFNKCCSLVWWNNAYQVITNLLSLVRNNLLSCRIDLNNLTVGQIFYLFSIQYTCPFLSQWPWLRFVICINYRDISIDLFLVKYLTQQARNFIWPRRTFEW